MNLPGLGGSGVDKVEFAGGSVTVVLAEIDKFESNRTIDYSCYKGSHISTSELLNCL